MPAVDQGHPAAPAPPTARPPRRLAVRVTDDACRQLRGGHPWVFDGSITSAPADGAAGDLAVLFDRRRRFQGIGLYDPGSPIRVRVLHAGAPVAITPAWWDDRLGAALDRRQELAASGDTTGYRVVHGENDGFPGLVLDRYGATAVLKLYSSAWVPHLASLVPLVAARLEPERLVLRLSRGVQAEAPPGARDGATLLGVPPTGPVTYLEQGLVLEADVVAGQKTGAFLDQRDNRRLVGTMAAGARVLDVFSCTGGFSLAAAAGGARTVRSVDRSEAALESARRSFARNAVVAGGARHETTCGDAFEAMATLAGAGERFDLVVVDPPSFASRRSSVPGALRAYARLTQLALPLLADGGVLVQASCSSRVGADEFVATVAGAARSAGAGFEELRRTGHPVDHPVGFPEGAYLKAVVARIRPAGRGR
jgi:23S rRNA (cytosine1962-C5)-methyltransferase